MNKQLFAVTALAVGLAAGNIASAGKVCEVWGATNLPQRFYQVRQQS